MMHKCFINRTMNYVNKHRDLHNTDALCVNTDLSTVYITMNEAYIIPYVKRGELINSKNYQGIFIKSYRISPVHLYLARDGFGRAFAK